MLKAKHPDDWWTPDITSAHRFLQALPINTPTHASSIRIVLRVSRRVKCLVHFIEMIIHQEQLASLSNSTCILLSTVTDHWCTPPETAPLRANIPLAKRKYAIPRDWLSIGRHSVSLAYTIRDVLIKPHVPTGGIDVQKSIRPRLCIDTSTCGRYLAKEEVYAFLHNFFET